ncbi:MAG: hypothetical protein NTU41_05280 [Chloroflexi bacterium]|nr:hypothetical protein [Chloroflexota bacterium]
MKMPKWVWGIAGVVIVLVLAVLGYAAVSRSGFVTRELAAGEVQGSEAGHYALDFFSDDGATRVATEAVRVA